jgi:hypothetical protein
MKIGLIAVMLLSFTCVVGGVASKGPLGSAVDGAVSATIYGGCGNETGGTCPAGGTCTSTSIVGYTGDGDWKQKTTVNCGSGGSCLSHSKTSQKCEG